MRVVLHGFGSFPIVFWHMIQYFCMLGGVCSLEDLKLRIAREMEAEISNAEAITAIATLMNARYEVSFGTPGAPGEPVSRRKNIESLTAAFIDHCRRVQLAANHSS